MAQASSYPTKSTPVAADTVLLVDSAASNAVKQATIDTVARVASLGVQVPRASGSALYAVDSSSTGSSLVIANNATATPFGAVVVRGMFFVWSTGDAVGALFFGDTSGASIISDRAGIFSTTATTASKINVYVTGGALTIENKRGSSVTLNVAAWRIA